MITPDEYRGMPTIHSGQYDNQVEDTGSMRVWVSRCGIADGMPENRQVTIERLRDGCWVTTHESRGNEWERV